MTEYSRFAASASFERRAMHWTLSDFLCGKLVQEQDNVLKAAVEQHKLITSVCQPQYMTHPFTIFFKKLLGLDGCREPDVALCAFLCT